MPKCGCKRPLFWAFVCKMGNFHTTNSIEHFSMLAVSYLIAANNLEAVFTAIYTAELYSLLKACGSIHHYFGKSIWYFKKFLEFLIYFPYHSHFHIWECSIFTMVQHSCIYASQMHIIPLPFPFPHMGMQYILHVFRGCIYSHIPSYHSHFHGICIEIYPYICIGFYNLYE